MAIVWKHSFEMPMYEGVHTTIHSFLRTSEFGGWEVNPSLASDVFVLNYCRGKNATSSPPSKLRYNLTPLLINNGYHDYVRTKWGGWKNPSMELTVRLRPLPNRQRIKVQVEQSLTGPNAELIVEINKGLGMAVDAEVKALLDYLKESYGFDETPEIACE